jgi:iron complex transport system substrate-binding protein
MAQIFLFTVAPDRLVGWSLKPTEEMRNYISAEEARLPVFGQFYGSVSNLNLEALIASEPQVIVDIGEVKKGIREDMDSIQNRTGIPGVFIKADTLDSYGDTYRALAELLGGPSSVRGQEALAQAQFCDRTIQWIRDGRKKLDPSKKVRIYYGEGASGLQTVPASSLHSQVIEEIGAENVAQIPITTGAGGNRVTMEQLFLWDPDMIIFGYGATAETVKQDPLWKELRAVKAGRVYTIPDAPYGWFGRPPSVNRIAGLYWLGSLAYPSVYEPSVAQQGLEEFYRLFYHHPLPKGR